MAIQKKEVEYAKEIGDVMVLIVELVKDVKAKKAMSELMSENLPHLINAIGGVDQVPAEIAEHKVVALQTVGLHIGELAAAILAEAPAAPVPPAAA